MSSTLLREHSLMAFVLHQNSPGSVMLSVPHPALPGQAAASLGSHGMTANPPESHLCSRRRIREPPCLPTDL